MSQFYLDESRAGGKYSLPDAEAFYAKAGELTNPETDEPEPAGWYWCVCFPGCLPEGEATGPFKTEAAAMKDAREMFGD